MDPSAGLQVGHGVTIPLTEVELRTSRSSGPGGQHANVTSSRIEASFDVTAARSLSEPQRARLLERLGPRVTAVAQDERSQLRNRELALERLRAKLDDGLRVRRPRRPTAPTAGARERRLQTKRATGARKAQRRPPQPEE